MSETLVNNILNKVQPKSKLIFVWSGENIPENFQTTVERLQERVGNENKINVEHGDRLEISNYSQSSFDFILSNLLTPQASTDSKKLANYLKLLKPNGYLVEFSLSSNLESELKLNGFKNVTLEKNGDNNLISFIAEKPNFEVGAVSKLKFASKSQTVPNEEKPKVWQFSQDDIQEDDLINTDDLLDDLDLKKPDPLDAKFDCGTSKSGKKKACKNCSCGLAEELENEASNQQKKNVQAPAKSACGSCYLGDAFRCASCPYLGMPAFKPGEKVQIGEGLLKADI